MTLSTVTLTWDLADLIQSGVNATITLTPTAVLTDTTDHIVIPQVARSRVFTGGTGSLPGIIACDNVNISPAGWAYTITITLANGTVLLSISAFINFANGATQDLSALTPLSTAPVLQSFTPPGRPATLIVAAANASAAWRNAADYICTGTADDVKINAAIAALPTWGGKIQLSDGQFNLATPVNMNVSDTLIEGAGIQSTTVAVTPGANCNAFQYTGTAAVIFCSLRNMLINGNSTTNGYSTNTTGYGIYIQPSGGGTFWDFHVRDVFAVHIAQDGFFSYDGHGYVLDHFLAELCTGAGVNFAHPGPSGASEPEVRNGTFKNLTGAAIIMGIQGGIVAENEIQIITGDGIQLTGAGSKATDNWIGSCTGNGITMSAFGASAKGNMIVSNTGNGITMTTGPGAAIGNYVELNSGYGITASATGCLIEGNHVGGNTLAGVQVTSNQGIVVTGNYIYLNGQQGVLCTAAVALIDGNSLSDNSQTTVNTYDEIQVTNNGATVTGNVINGNSQSRYGINFSNGASVNQVATANNISNMATAASNSATASVTWLANTGVTNSLTAASSGGAPASCIAQTMPWWSASVSTIAAASGTLYLHAVTLPAGIPVSNITFAIGGTAGATLTHGWYVLLNSALLQVAHTADQTSGGLTGAATKALVTPYTPVTTGLYYIGYMVVGGTQPTFCGSAATQGGAMFAEFPSNGASSTGLTTPGTDGTTSYAAITGAGSPVYGYCS